MSKITLALRQDVRVQAEKFLAEHGFTKPPLSPEEALAARKLEVSQLSLDDLLVKANLSPKEQGKIQAVLDIEDKAITFRSGLPMQKRNWGSLHEVGHEFLPWHRELLYCCPLLWLPVHIQEQLEAEADIFAAEAFFFGIQFMQFANEGEFGLATGKELADKIYKTSYHATFMHLVEGSKIPCCLLVWRPVEESSELIVPSNLKLHYYVPSQGFRLHFVPNQIADDEVVIKLFNDPSFEIVKHEMQLELENGSHFVAQAESFCNSYNVFTLVFKPEPRKLK